MTASEEAKEKLLSYPNVVAVGHGKERVKGDKTGTTALVAFVRRKMPLSELEEEDRLPSEIEGVKIDVQEIGEVSIEVPNVKKCEVDEQSGKDVDPRKRQRPYPQGFSIGHEDITAGTAGGIRWVEDSVKIAGKSFTYAKPVQVSNNHVLCHDADTEVLTRNDGWVKWPEVTENHQLATLSDSEELEFQYPTSVHEHDYDGVMHHYEGKFYDMMVTPEHRMWARNIAGHTIDESHMSGDFTFKKSKDIVERIDEGKTTSVVMDRSVKWNCTAVQEIPISSSSEYKNEIENVEMADFLKFFGWYMGDGSTGVYSHPVRGDSYTTHIKTSPHNKDDLKDLVSSLGLNGHWAEYEGYGSMHIHSKQLNEFLSEFGGSGDKYVPQWVKELPPEQLEDFYEGYLISDGCKTDKGYHQFVSKSKDLADDIYEIAFKLGKVANLTKIEGSGYNPEGIYWQVTAYENKHRVLVDDVEEINYEGKVYCATVPNDILLTRRNGKAIWSGNSNENKVSSGDSVLQPGPHDGGKNIDEDYRVNGEDVEYVTIDFEDSNELDIAWHDFYSDRQAVSYNPQAGLASDTYEVSEGEEVFKGRSRTTPYREGQVLSTDATVNVKYGSGTAKFKNQILTESISRGGDSGSQVFITREGQTKWVGNLFAGSSKVTVINPAETILDKTPLHLNPEDVYKE